MGPRIIARISTGVALIGALIVGSPPTQAADLDYVALGDSYSSGTGTRDYYDTNCQRSQFAYAELTADRLGAALDMQACAGATVASVTANQLETLDAETDLVTMTVGGNDAGFADVLLECAKPGWLSNCEAAIDDAQAYIRDVLPGSLDGLYDKVASSAPNATVAIGSYPRLFMGEDCNAGTWFSPQEQERLNATADQLAAVISEQADAHGFAFADVRDAFVGHAVCDEPAWVNGLSNPIRESYHPNRAGHVGYTDVFDTML